MLINRPEFDSDIFITLHNKEAKEFVYNSQEINWLIDQISWFTEEHPICKQIIELLNTTANFRYATTLDKSFVVLRNVTKTPEELNAPFNEMVIDLKKSQQTLNKLNPDSLEYKLLNDATHYCMQSIRLRIKQLQITDDVTYKFCWHGSELQELIKLNGEAHGK